MENRFLDVITTRKTVHKYSSQPVDEAVIERSLVAAHAAPCHKLTWPWRFIIVGLEARAKLVDLNTRLKAGGEPPSDTLREKVHAKMMDPSHLIVVTQVRNDNAFRSKEDYAAVSCAIQNLTLSLHAEGVASKWSTGGVTRHAETYAALGVDEALEEIVGFIWAGYPFRESPLIQRPPISEFVRRVD